MIRAGLIIVGLLLGALAGSLWALQAGQLRAFLGEAAPQGLSMVDADARLANGALTLAQTPGGQPPLRLNWSNPHISDGAPNWDIRLTAAGLDAHGTAQVGVNTAQIQLDTALLDLAQATPPTAGITGQIALRSGVLQMDWRAKTLESVTATGQVGRLVWQTETLGDFSLAVIGRPPKWRIELASAADNPITATVVLTGLSGGPELRMNLFVQDTDTLPEPTRITLQRIATREAEGWRLEQPIMLPVTLP